LIAMPRETGVNSKKIHGGRTAPGKEGHMHQYMETLRARLSQQDRELLQAVHAPVVVAEAPEDAWRSLCISETGELRAYGIMGRETHDGPGQRFYLRSEDCGLSWKRIVEKEPRAMGPAVRSPHTGNYLTLVSDFHLQHGPEHLPVQQAHPEVHVWALRSAVGFDDTEYACFPVTDRPVTNIRLPIPLQKRARWICTGQIMEAGIHHPVVMYSDDDGATWDLSVLDSAPPHVPGGVHRDVRWQNGSNEPTVCELQDGTLLMLARTSQDFHYIYYSYDGGETWTAPQPSTLHATLTQPTLRTLSDGSVLVCWCNTQPLPELDHTTQWPPLNHSELTGGSEDVFTNRDANHAALSRDGGKTWMGMRELALNPIRNDADFRSKGGNVSSLDKSIHQFEMLELPYRKVLVVYGQHTSCRKIALFSLDWLCEQGRRENFRTGCGQLSTQVYYKSNSGNFRGFSGHCAWNRTSGAILVPDPSGNFEEALHICRTDDPRLFSNVQGAVWNFPAAHAGQVRVRMRIDGVGLRLSLLDRWINPIDWTVDQCAQVTFLLRAEQLERERWTDVVIRWETGTASLEAEGQVLAKMSFQQAAPNGLSYLHLQAAAEERDYAGALIKELEMR